MTEAQFSQHMTALVDAIAAESVFAVIKRRQVNVLNEMEFPLFAAWVDRSGDSGQSGSDGEIEEEATYFVLVAAVLEGDQSQDVELGKLVKVVIDAARNFTSADGVEYVVGDWEGDNNANEGDGSKVWAAMPITIQFSRPSGDY